jgi:hypothetical protein
VREKRSNSDPESLRGLSTNSAITVCKLRGREPRISSVNALDWTIEWNVQMNTEWEDSLVLHQVLADYIVRNFTSEVVLACL